MRMRSAQSSSQTFTGASDATRRSGMESRNHGRAGEVTPDISPATSVRSAKRAVGSRMAALLCAPRPPWMGDEKKLAAARIDEARELAPTRLPGLALALQDVEACVDVMAEGGIASHRSGPQYRLAARGSGRCGVGESEPAGRDRRGIACHRGCALLLRIARLAHRRVDHRRAGSGPAAEAAATSGEKRPGRHQRYPRASLL